MDRERTQHNLKVRLTTLCGRPWAFGFCHQFLIVGTIHRMTMLSRLRCRNESVLSVVVIQKRLIRLSAFSVSRARKCSCRSVGCENPAANFELVLVTWTMGLLSEGSPLSWEETKKLSEHVRKHGIRQFINLYKRLRDRQGDVLKWGDEVHADQSLRH